MSNAPISFKGVKDPTGFRQQRSLDTGQPTGVPVLDGSKFQFEFVNGMLQKYYLPIAEMPKFNDVADGNLRTFYHVNFPGTFSDGNSFYNAYSFDRLPRNEREHFPAALTRFLDDLKNDRFPEMWWDWTENKEDLISYASNFAILAQRQLDDTRCEKGEV